MYLLLSMPLDSASVKSRAPALVASMSPHYFWLLWAIVVGKWVPIHAWVEKLKQEPPLKGVTQISDWFLVGNLVFSRIPF